MNVKRFGRSRMIGASGGWRPVLLYGVALAAGATLLQWLDYARLARTRPGDLALALVAAGFLALGLFVGHRLGRPPAPTPLGNPAAAAALGLSPRELAVLAELAQGRSNKEIARALGVSPNTIKTHLARLYEKLGARRRTEAIAHARELGLLA